MSLIDHPIKNFLNNISKKFKIKKHYLNEIYDKYKFINDDKLLELTPENEIVQIYQDNLNNNYYLIDNDTAIKIIK